MVQDCISGRKNLINSSYGEGRRGKGRGGEGSGSSLVSPCSWQVVGHPGATVGHYTLQMNFPTFAGGKAVAVWLLGCLGFKAGSRLHCAFLFVVGIFELYTPWAVS